MGATLGFHCSHEQHPPSALLRYVQRAAEAGFTAAMCSDHFHPWSERQGHSGFAWTWLGAALQATSLSFGTVCAPGQRYHPAVIAQAAATLAEMYPQRFWLAIGSGEALNEAITGGPWPPKAERNARLKQSAEVIRALWSGETVSTRGHITTARATLYSRPSRPPLLLGAALSPETARWIASWADGMVTVAGPRDSMRAVVDAFREGGGEAKPMFLQVALAFGSTDEEGRHAAYDQWRQSALQAKQLADLETPIDFDRACANADPKDVWSKIRVSSDVTRQLDWLYEDCALGFERIYLHNLVRGQQERFIEACGTHLIPGIAKASQAGRERQVGA
jgi:coenzyme F420-dependent glucose-6-phosphate dehydrogenase